MAKTTPAGRATPTPPITKATARAIGTTAPGLAPQHPPPVVKDDPIKVRATNTGYYDHVRRRDGDVFIIANQRAFSAKWMELVDPRARESFSTSASELRRKHDEILGGTVGQATGDRHVLGE